MAGRAFVGNWTREKDMKEEGGRDKEGDREGNGDEEGEGE